MLRDGPSRRSRAIREWPLWAQYALSVGAMATAAAVRIPLYPVLGDRVAFITLFMVMLPLVLLVRAGPFLVASLLGLLAIGVGFRNRYLLGNAEGTVELALFGLAAGVATLSAWLAQRADTRRRRADAMLRAFVDEAPACKWITGPDGRIVYANQAMADALGRPVDEVIGRTHAELLPAKLAELAVSHIQAVRQSGEPRASFEEIEPLDGTGTRRILDWRRFALKLGVHDHVLVAGMANDVTEKVRMERALRDSEVRYRSLFEVAVYGVVTIDERGTIESANPAAERLFGYTQAEMVGRNVSMLMPEPYRGQHDAYLGNYLRTGERKIIGIGREVEGRRKDGSTFPMDLAVSEFEHHGGRYFQGVVQDISERKRAETALRESEAALRAKVEELQAIFDLAPVQIWLGDAECRAFYGNKWAYSEHGLRPGTNASFDAPIRELPEGLRLEVDGRALRPHDMPMQVAARTGRPVERFEHEVVHPDGRRQTMIANVMPLFHPDGKVRGVLGVYTDITARKRDEQALRESEQRLRGIIKQLPVGVGVMDADGSWLITNQMMDLYVPGAIPSLLPDRSVRWQAWDEHGDPIPPADWPGKRALRGESVIPGLEMLYTHEDGRETWMRVSAAPLRNDAGETIGATCVVQDIDLSKRFSAELGMELAKRTEEVERAARAAAVAQRMAAVGTMASGLAHDLKNVLLPLSSRLDSVLDAEGVGGEARTDLAVVVALVDHLRQMALNVELFARDPEQEGSEGVTRLAPWCRRVQRLLENSLDAGDRRAGRWIRLHCDVPEGLPAVAIAPHRLTQSVLNLVHNARDAILARREDREEHSGPAGAITLEARATDDGSAVVITLTDDGLGMDDETRRRCTEPFFTTKDRSGAGVGGSGLGLALVRAITVRVGGQLHVESEVGKGTMVTMRLPVAPSASADAAPGPIGRVRVSIEDKRTRALIVETLRSLRYETLDGHPEPESPSIAWVTDSAGAKPEDVALFLRVRPGRRVVVLGGDDAWRQVGAIVCDYAGAPAVLRKSLAVQTHC